jgi:SAM-dependent methyltransferase
MDVELSWGSPLWEDQMIADNERGYAQAYGESFARVYNDYWSFFARRMAPKLLELLGKSDVPETAGRTVLDVCCGTGQLAAELLAHGYEVIGIDLSEPMLRYARTNNVQAVEAGRATFTVQNASSFSVDRPCAYAVSLYDALNHLPEESALRGCFESVYSALSARGLFVFDLNTAKGLARWNGIDIEDSDEVTIINRGIYAEGAARAFTSITGFVRRPDGAYDRFREVVYETVFASERVRAMLAEAGFVDAYVADSDDLTTPTDHENALGRAFYVCRKP